MGRFWTGKHFPGNSHIVAPAPLDRLPLFVRAGAVLPMERSLNHTDERDGEELFLHVYAPSLQRSEGEDDEILGHLQLYEDAGEGFAYKKASGLKLLLS